MPYQSPRAIENGTAGTCVTVLAPKRKIQDTETSITDRRGRLERTNKLTRRTVIWPKTTASRSRYEGALLDWMDRRTRLSTTRNPSKTSSAALHPRGRPASTQGLESKRLNRWREGKCFSVLYICSRNLATPTRDKVFHCQLFKRS